MSKAPKSSLQNAWDDVGGLSKPSKIPCYSFSTPASRCNVGTRLQIIADSTCSGCYALRGRYRFRNTQQALENRHRKLDSDTWVESMVTLINELEHSEYFRWHDSGDIKSVKHLSNIVEVAKRTPSVRHWLPTREYRTVSIWRKLYGEFPSNLAVRLSAHMRDSDAPKVGLPTSTVVKDIKQATCPATLPSSDHKCHDCRACWSNNPDSNVAYYKH